MTVEAGEMLTADETAAALGCSVRQVRRLRRVGALTDVWIGANGLRIPRQSVEDFVRLGGVPRDGGTQ